jgi:hypothetical protein
LWLTATFYHKKNGERKREACADIPIPIRSPIIRIEIERTCISTVIPIATEIEYTTRIQIAIICPIFVKNIGAYNNRLSNVSLAIDKKIVSQTSINTVNMITGLQGSSNTNGLIHKELRTFLSSARNIITYIFLRYIYYKK